MPDSTLRLATWNINSISARLDYVVDWLVHADVDALAMQETKCSDSQFPTLLLYELGCQTAHVSFQPVERRRDSLPHRPRGRTERLLRPALLE